MEPAAGATSTQTRQHHPHLTKVYEDVHLIYDDLNLVHTPLLSLLRSYAAVENHILTPPTTPSLYGRPCP